MSDAKVVVAGAGRAGTSLLLDVLTDLGFDTGRDASGTSVPPIESPRAPRIVADRGLAHRLATVLDVQAVDVEHVIVPVRALDTASASRLRATRYGARLHRVDSPVRRTYATAQRAALGVELYELTAAIARFDLPHTFLAFPRFAQDWRYLAQQLGFLDPSITPSQWRDALERHADPARIREERLSRRERVLTGAGAALDGAARVLHGVRRALGDVATPLRNEEAGAGSARADVVVHVASINTKPATELCIRTMRHYAGHPFELVVGDCGSTDGSLEMLRDYEDRGWLTLEVAPDGRMHAEWLDRWLRGCPARYAVFCDSDIEFFEPDWLDDMVRAAQTNDCALVCAQMLPPRGRFVHPHTGAKRTLGPRPAPWLMLVDVEKVRGRVDASFAYLDVVAPEAFGGKIGYDVGGAFFMALQDAGLGWVEMPESFRAAFRHFSGLSWRRLYDWHAPLRLRPGQLPRMATVIAHLWRARLLRYGESAPARFRNT